MAEQKQLQALSDEYQSIQTELSSLVQVRQRLEQQRTENKSVQKEFSTLSSSANVYKLVGPVLLKQEPSEAKNTVDSRLEYIEKEINRIEGNIKETQEKSESKKAEIIQIQSQMQQQSQSQQQQQQGVAAG